MIRLLTPSMPSIEAALPYIRRSEEAKHYSNFGPCVIELERRLSEKYAGAFVITVANATIGLEIVYLLKMIQGFKQIELPALTFPATWLAANRAGLEILPIDVDKDTWVAPGVSGFGVPTYAPVVDAAGAFGEQTVPLLRGGMTAVFSMHATKSVGAGEGGYIVTWSEQDAALIRQMTNFGIDNGVSSFAGTNGKLSEYAAAMGLASLDAWDREAWCHLHDWYDKHLPACVVRQKRPRGAYTLMPVRVPGNAVETQERLKAVGVETRRWYCPAMHHHPLFEYRGNREYRRANPLNLPVTDDLEEHLLGLPYHLFLTENDVKQVCESLEESVAVVV